ncbi:Hsp70 family protein [Corynebacterium amycolatum]|uniref:Hsp70 family protein n=1 Tax=Corynebacterium amycolatum TaxID=43765 RepID=A0AAW9SUW8_CORAY|nr:Hsp70 family protein [Corynebacterium amycolatum]MDK7238244.1 Hsp70 family protein [Corynebacterium amycolatum]MDK7248182.1 Hsp70 family protein [Corynebacterium amycolatum]
MSEREWSLGVDFGTSNTAAAHTNQIKQVVEPVSLAHDRMTMSSSVYMDDPEEFLVGDVALDRAESNPGGLIRSPKRFIPQQVFQKNGYDIPSSSPVAAVLQSVVARACKEHNGTRPSELVLTHPEEWSEREIQVLLDAAQQLGLSATKVTTISEPKAAATYYTKSKELKPGEKIAVFDFGGGTLDIAVLEVGENHQFSVVAAHGDNTIGGQSFDALIRRWVDRQLEEINPELKESLRSEATVAEKHALMDSIRRAKELLSETAQATIKVAVGPDVQNLQITRGEFEEAIADMVSRAVDITRDTLSLAGINSSDDLAALYLTGGSSRVPYVQEQLKELGPLATLDDPKTVVAQGALTAVAPIVGSLTAQTSAPPVNSVSSGRAGQYDLKSTPTAPDSSGVHSSAAEQPTRVEPVPNYGPSGSSQKAEDSTSKSNSKKFGLIGAAVIAVIAVAAAGMWFLRPSDSDPSATEPAGEPSAATSAAGDAGTEAPSDFNETTPLKDLIAAIPEELRDGLGTCTYMDVSNLTVSCDIEKGARYSAYGLGTSESSFGQSVNFTFKDGEVRSQRAFIRDQKKGLTLTSEDKRLSAHSEGDFGNETEGEQTVRFVNMNKGVYVVFHAVPTADDAERLMREVLVPGAPEAQWKSGGKS